MSGAGQAPLRRRCVATGTGVHLDGTLSNRTRSAGHTVAANRPSPRCARLAPHDWSRIMLTFVTYAETIVTENRRHERIEQAMRDRAITTATRTAVASDRITAAAGRCVPAAIAGPW